jgi:methionyl-tRNA formyltransferase
MKIDILCSDVNHPVYEYIKDWIANGGNKHNINLVNSKFQLSGGDILFLVSCTEKISIDSRFMYRKCLVLHASDLPRGRGWSPHIWEILSGAEEITLAMIQAEEKIDSGDIWQKIIIPVPRHFLWDEISEIVILAEIKLIEFAICNLEKVVPYAQPIDIDPTYYPRRSTADSEISPCLSIEEQFDKIRVCDPNRYPAFFDLHGFRYKLTVEKINAKKNCN